MTAVLLLLTAAAPGSEPNVVPISPNLPAHACSVPGGMEKPSLFGRLRAGWGKCSCTPPYQGPGVWDRYIEWSARPAVWAGGFAGKGGCCPAAVAPPGP